jgi:hypothetical protein
MQNSKTGAVCASWRGERQLKDRAVWRGERQLKIDAIGRAGKQRGQIGGVVALGFSVFGIGGG